MFDWLNGKKTYLVAALAIATAAIGYYNGTLTAEQAIEAILLALGISGVRHGVTTEAKK